MRVAFQIARSLWEVLKAHYDCPIPYSSLLWDLASHWPIACPSQGNSLRLAVPLTFSICLLPGALLLLTVFLGVAFPLALILVSEPLLAAKWIVFTACLALVGPLQ